MRIINAARVFRPRHNLGGDGDGIDAHSRLVHATKFGFVDGEHAVTAPSAPLAGKVDKAGRQLRARKQSIYLRTSAGNGCISHPLSPYHVDYVVQLLR